jgi:transcriptional repressor NrdR
MKCPFCREADFGVVDSRNHHGGFPIRRRRYCPRCKRRAWTVEQIEEVPLKVIKKDETREPFDAAKLREGLEKACYKRPIGAEQIEAIVRLVEAEIYGRYFAEVPTTMIGDLVMEQLRQLDQVAYVRFASVYRAFKDVSDFVEEVRPMIAHGRNGLVDPAPGAKEDSRPRRSRRRRKPPPAVEPTARDPTAEQTAESS